MSARADEDKQDGNTALNKPRAVIRQARVTSVRGRRSLEGVKDVQDGGGAILEATLSTGITMSNMWIVGMRMTTMSKAKLGKHVFQKFVDGLIAGTTKSIEVGAIISKDTAQKTRNDIVVGAAGIWKGIGGRIMFWRSVIGEGEKGGRRRARRDGVARIGKKESMVKVFLSCKL